MEEKKLDDIFKDLNGSFDIEKPNNGHQQRFLEKLNAPKGTVAMTKKRTNWWKPLSIAASLAVLLGLFISQFGNQPDIDEQVAEISPEVSSAQFHFASLIEEQVRELESEKSPVTQKIITDTMVQLKKLEKDYTNLEQELLNGGNSKLILSAMITNFQTRIDLLNDVLSQIETIKNLKNYDDANFTI